MNNYFHREKYSWNVIHPLQFQAIWRHSATLTGPFFIQEFCNSITSHPTGLKHGYNFFFFTTHTHFSVWDGYAQQSPFHLAFLSRRHKDINALCLRQRIHICYQWGTTHCGRKRYSFIWHHAFLFAPKAKRCCFVKQRRHISLIPLFAKTASQSLISFEGGYLR